ncbi:unnamed protein product [Alternaria alternata]
MEFCAVVKRDLGAQPDGVLDICYYATRVTLDIIGIAGMGRDLGSLYNKDDELAKNYQEILEPTPEKVLYYLTNVVLPPWLVRKLPWRLHERVQVTTRNLRRICSEFLVERKMRVRCEKVEGQESRDILSIMIRSDDQSDKNLVDQLLTFVAAGGTMFWIVPWAINRSPKLWGPDAEDFVPEHWMDTTTGRATMNGGAESNYSFLTFLHGPRGCIGERFARAELRSLVATFVGNLEMELADPNEEIVVGGTLISKPRNGMKLRLEDVKWGS